MDNHLQSLYHPLILRHDREPCRFEKRPAATHVLQANNPICGDRFDVFFDLKNGNIEQLSFHGYGCAVSKASASVLVKNLENQSVAAAKQHCAEFLRTASEGGPGTAGNEEFVPFAAARHFPGRQQCATLAWEAMLEFLNKI